mgnify:CR=1
MKHLSLIFLINAIAIPCLENAASSEDKSADLSQITQSTHKQPGLLRRWMYIPGIQSLRNMCSSRKPKSIQSSASESQLLELHKTEGPQTVEEWLMSIVEIQSLLGEKSSEIQEVLENKIPQGDDITLLVQSFLLPTSLQELNLDFIDNILDQHPNLMRVNPDNIKDSQLRNIVQIIQGAVLSSPNVRLDSQEIQKHIEEMAQILTIPNINLKVRNAIFSNILTILGNYFGNPPTEIELPLREILEHFGIKQNIKLILQGVKINSLNYFYYRHNNVVQAQISDYINKMIQFLNDNPSMNLEVKSHIRVNIVRLLSESYDKLNQAQKSTLKEMTQDLSDKEVLRLFNSENGFFRFNLDFSIIEYMTTEQVKALMQVLDISSIGFMVGRSFSFFRKSSDSTSEKRKIILESLKSAIKKIDDELDLYEDKQLNSYEKILQEKAIDRYSIVSRILERKYI